jgi:hypothetical protein
MSSKLTSGPNDFRFARNSGLELHLRLQVLPFGPNVGMLHRPMANGSPQELL